MSTKKDSCTTAEQTETEIAGLIESCVGEEMAAAEVHLERVDVVDGNAYLRFASHPVLILKTPVSLSPDSIVASARRCVRAFPLPVLRKLLSRGTRVFAGSPPEPKESA